VMALCLHVLDSDGQVLEVEKKALKQLIQEQYGLDDAGFRALLLAGKDAEANSVDLYRFTSTLKRHLSDEEKADFIGLLWQLVYADGVRSELEDHVVWRISDLMEVSGRVRIMKRQDAEAHLGGNVVKDDNAEFEA